MNKIKELRKAKLIKQWELCKTLGVSQGTLSAWETGRWEPDIKSLMRLCEIFDCTADFLLGRTETNSHHSPVCFSKNKESMATLYLRTSNSVHEFALVDCEAQALLTILEGLKKTKESTSN